MGLSSGLRLRWARWARCRWGITGHTTMGPTWGHHASSPFTQYPLAITSVTDPVTSVAVRKMVNGVVTRVCDLCIYPALFIKNQPSAQARTSQGSSNTVALQRLAIPWPWCYRCELGATVVHSLLSRSAYYFLPACTCKILRGGLLPSVCNDIFFFCPCPFQPVVDGLLPAEVILALTSSLADSLACS